MRGTWLTEDKLQPIRESSEVDVPDWELIDRAHEHHCSGAESLTSHEPGAMDVVDLEISMLLLD
jgi:hypothetical protein